MSKAVGFDTNVRQTPATKKRRVFVTGASGKIGSYFSEYACELYDLTLMIRPTHNENRIASFGRVVRANLEEKERLSRLLEGIDTVVHLAANPNQFARWEQLTEGNITGLYNLFSAAKDASCRRVVFASSIHTVTGYPSEHQVHPDDSVSPGDLYGVTKCFGEAVARYMSNQHGLSSICIRIGSFQPREKINESHLNLMHTFISHRDMAQLIVRCIDNEDIKFAIVNGLSDNGLFNRMDISETKELLGYKPKDNFVKANKLMAKLFGRK